MSVKTVMSCRLAGWAERGRRSMTRDSVLLQLLYRWEVRAVDRWDDCSFYQRILKLLRWRRSVTWPDAVARQRMMTPQIQICRPVSRDWGPRRTVLTLRTARGQTCCPRTLPVNHSSQWSWVPWRATIVTISREIIRPTFLTTQHNSSSLWL